ncbi:transient receptor potential cation channel subfamily M member-like 2 isoform X2 [Aplysia californica]|uniref:Transient receptor potential cation channel subfamily M member-like 2 isoform X2 n=1 Tax=Aplysia californica TaxID=6500 RepID=A0ABM1W056_APLCA|nr:transient receptor potential cation channel subfamily M member-like 2 isoform X2 [Aplysia californica]
MPKAWYRGITRKDDGFDEDREVNILNMPRVAPNERPLGSTVSLGQTSMQSLKFDDKAINIEEQGAFVDYSLTNQEVRFMKKVKRRECKSFIEKTNQDPSLDEPVCQCDYPKSRHSEEAINAGQAGGKWMPGLHTKSLPTNAFGEIEFVGYGDKVGKYVRVDVDTPMDTMLSLLTEAWGMEKPNLLISVTGGAKNFTMKARLREVFRRGLMKAALSTGAWIVTGGTNTGVMKHVGEAVRDFGLTSEGRVMTIGIAPWGCVQNKEHLITNDNQGKWPALYRIEKDVKKRQSFLDPNHTHFILVDNGTQMQFTVEIPFRAKLEEAIAAQKTDTGTDAVAVPVCLLVLEGGPGTLQTVHSSLMSATPTVVIKGSGKTADILAYAYQNAREEEVIGLDQQGNEVKGTNTILDPHVLAEITEMVQTTFGEASLATRVQWVRECCRNLDLLSVFELDSKNSARDVDLAILKALLKANKHQVMDQLKLALAWNRIDVAKSEIFTDERRWPTGMLDEVMMSAIQLNRVDFVELFLDNGVSLKDFLSIKRLIMLYNEIPRNSLLYTLLTRVKGKMDGGEERQLISIADVGHLIQELLGDFYQPHYLTDQRLRDIDTDALFGLTSKKTGIKRGITMAQLVTSSAATGSYIDPSQGSDNIDFSRPAQELFIWAVLMNHRRLSKVFWREGKEATAAALFASSICKSMRRYTFDAELGRQLEATSEDYAQLAVGVINTCYGMDERRTHELLIRDMPHWGCSTCVLLAAQSDNKPFISQTACQSLLNSIWMGKIAHDNSLLWIISSILLFPLVQFGIRFKEDDQPKQVEIQGTSLSEENGNTTSKEKPRLARRDTNIKPALSREPTTFQLDVQASESTPPKKGYSILDKHFMFYRSPVVRFSVNVIAYIVFLLLYAYILVVQLTREFHVVEGILIGWVFAIFVEEIRQLTSQYAHTVQSKIISYIHDRWNVLDVVTILLFILGMVFRFIENDDFMDAARVILSINFITFFFRVLHIFSVSKQLGPKVVMITRMVQDLLWFVVILLVFIVSYAIASEAVLYPNSELNWKLLFFLPRKAYWHVYGELLLEDIEGESSCTNDPALYNNYTELRCPSTVGRYFVPILMGCYILLTNVLLLNLLIAMFSYTFQSIQENTDMHWCFLRFNLVYEYTQRPALPPPFIIFSHVYIFWRYACCRRGQRIHPFDEFRKEFSSKLEEKQLIQWENVIADNYLSVTEKSEANSVSGRVKSSLERLETILAKVDELQESHGAVGQGPQGLPADGFSVQIPPMLQKRLDSVEKQLVLTTQALDWIMKSLQENNMATKTAKPLMPDLEKEKKEEEKKKKKKEEKEKKLVQDLMEKKINSHYKSRLSPYLGSNVTRFSVPDEKVLWEIEFPDYDPPTYTSVEVLKQPAYADEDLLAMSPEVRKERYPFNQYDKKCRISRVSLYKPYDVVDGLPVNPIGRTGLRGRGALGRWGPNHAGDPIVTRWKMLDDGTCAMKDGKPVLQFVAVQRKDNSLWSIPGGICSPGEEPWNILKADFSEDVHGTLLDNPEAKREIMAQLDQLAALGHEVYNGYADDPRNTDNAWLETRVVNYHDAEGKILHHFNLRAGDEVELVTWQTIGSHSNLHGAHSFFLKLVADRHQAAF